MQTIYKVLHVQYNYVLTSGFETDKPLKINSVDVRVSNQCGNILMFHFDKNPYVNVGDEITVVSSGTDGCELCSNLTQSRIIEEFKRTKQK